MSPSLVQSASNTGTTGTSVTATFGAGTTAGNCVVACVGTGGASLRTVSGVTLGGAAGNFAVAKAQSNSSTVVVDCEIWTDQNCAGGQTAVKASYSGVPSASAVWAEEWAGISASSAVDKTNSAGASSTSWSSGASGTLSQASEVVLGAVYCATNAAVTITGPGSPWTNLAQAGGSGGLGLLAGYQIVSATTTQTYSGTQNGSAFESNAAVIVTLKAAAANVTGTLAAAMAAMKLAAAGTETISGTLAAAAAPMKLAASGAEVMSGALAVAAAPMKLAATGTETVSGTLAMAAAPMRLAAAGQQEQDVTGTLSVAAAPMKLAASGTGPRAVQGGYPYHHREGDRR